MALNDCYASGHSARCKEWIWPGVSKGPAWAISSRPAKPQRIETHTENNLVYLDLDQGSTSKRRA
jgi:hypothetical protein